uniref:Uncharacterized protein n=1 Tax=Chrysotila carterae TaxID=13221 RepID=A0A7S4C3K4_CHRCT
MWGDGVGANSAALVATGEAACGFPSLIALAFRYPQSCRRHQRNERKATDAKYLCILSQPKLRVYQPELSAPTVDECATVKRKWPTLLGTHPWDCYWEWVLQPLGTNTYMHRPLYWAILEFREAPAPGATVTPGRASAHTPVTSSARTLARVPTDARTNTPIRTEQSPHPADASHTLAASIPSDENDRVGNSQRVAAGSGESRESEAVCRPIEWPPRYLVRNLYAAQSAFLKQFGRYANTLHSLLRACTPPACDAASMRAAADDTSIFSFSIHVAPDDTAPSAKCPRTPCFGATITAVLPLVPPYEVNVSIDSTSRVHTAHSLPAGLRPCL